MHMAEQDVGREMQNTSVQRHRPLRNMPGHIGDDAPRWRLDIQPAGVLAVSLELIQTCVVLSYGGEFHRVSLWRRRLWPCKIAG